MFAAMAAQNLAMVDVKGDYRARFCLLLAMLVIITGSVALGAFAWSGGWPVALAATVLIAIASGLWRHVSSDYGPTIAVVSALVFFISLAGEAHGGRVLPATLATLAGGGFGLLLQVALWPWRAQHPLRRVVADSWLALADLFETMSTPPDAVAPPPADAPARARRARQAADAEGALRVAVDNADRMLATAAAGSAGRRHVAGHLVELNLWAARVAMAGNAVATLLDSPPSSPSASPPASAAWQRQLAASAAPLFTGLANLGRSVALAVVSRQPGHLATCEIRLRRLEGILQAVGARAHALSARHPEAAHMTDLLRALGQRLSALEEAVRVTVERAGERAAFPLELLDLKTWQLRPLAATINLKPRPDPVLVRFVLRLAVLLAAGTGAFYWLDLPHGYWLPLTIVVVLQPDYGATRARAAQRLAGTVAGSLFASFLLWLRLPPGVELGAVAVSVFLFCYLVRRHYAVAVFFVTVFVVLLMEASGVQTAGIALERTGATLAGGLIALGAAMLFWPVWERDRLPPLIAGALRASRDYLAALVDRLARGGGVDNALVQAKRAAETANVTVFTSLRRLYGDPRNRRERVELAAALANGTQRLTRIATLFMMHVRSGSEPGAFSPAQEQTAQVILRALDALAGEVARGFPGTKNPPGSGHGSSPTTRPPNLLAVHALALDTLQLPPEQTPDGWASASLGRAAAEVRGMIAELDA
ncbi:membrane protein [Opitutaceae bacterium TAV5]|nr:membrane protein [Opitutaceae bacterium TAV5]